MDWYSPGKPIIGLSPHDNIKDLARQIAARTFRELNGLETYICEVKNLCREGEYKKYEYELLEIYQNCIESDYVRKSGVFYEKAKEGSGNRR